MYHNMTVYLIGHMCAVVIETSSLLRLNKVLLLCNLIWSVPSSTPKVNVPKKKIGLWMKTWKLEMEMGMQMEMENGK